MSTSSSSHSAIAENANATATHAEELEDTNPSPEDVFSPPSTAYFRFLTGLAPGSRHPTSGIHPFATDSSTSSCNRESLASPTSALVPPLPSSQPSTSQASMVAMTGDEHRAEEMHQDVGARGDNSMAFMEDEERDEEEHADDASPRSMSSLDSFGSGREARLDELMERVVPDFPDASALSCHRNSITTSMPNMASLASMTGLTSGVAGVAPGGAGSGGVSGYSSGNNNNNMGSSSSTSSMPPLPLQDALPLPSPAQRPLPPLMPSQYAMGAHSASSPAIASAPLPNFSAGLHPMHQHYFPPQHQALPQPQPQPTGTESAASIGRRSSLADDMRLLLQQQGILPAQPPQSPMVGTTAVMQSQGGRRGGNAAVGSFEPLSLSIGSEPDEAAGTFQQQQQQQDVPLEQRVSYMALRETESSPDSLAPLPTLASFATAYANTTGSSGRSSGRRASLPANRLEM
ncbi:hypothetical protein BGZ73_002392 [Actinomortierella ambigua]|nr:hypothetical protein BGZ73_002392 [Actinomortierella ambigua]